MIFAAFAVLIRVPVYLISLLGSKVDRRGALLIAWYGPSGLSSLLLILLAVFAGLPGSDRLFAVCSLIVLISIVIHGASPMLLARITGRNRAEEPRAPEIPQVSRSLPVIESQQPVGAQSITLEELDQLQKSGEKVILLDVRTERSRETSDFQATGFRAHAAGKCSTASSSARSPKGGLAHCLLRLTKRSHQRPCGAGTSTSRMDQSTCSHWRLGSVAKRKLAASSPGNRNPCAH